MIRPSFVLASFVVLAAVSGCVGAEPTAPAQTGISAGRTGDPSSGAGTSSDAPRATPAPAELVGTWTAGRGGTTIAYDAITGTSSSNASGLAYQFAGDGTFAKAFRDSTGGACAMIVVATESGNVQWGDGTLHLESGHGTTRTWSTCSSSVSTQELSPDALDRHDYTWQLDGDELVLTRDDGSSARFQRSP